MTDVFTSPKGHSPSADPTSEPELSKRLGESRSNPVLPRYLVQRSRIVLMPAAIIASALACADEPGRPPGPTAPAYSETLGGSTEPEIFAPGVISDERWQWRLTFTPNGKTAYFSVSDGFFPGTRLATILVSQRDRRGRRGQWSTPEVAPFSGTYSDIDPFITPNGRRLYFSSNRPVDGSPRDDFDIWFVERTTSGWSEPIHAGPAVNGDLDELYPSATAFGTLYFASGPPAPSPDADWDLYRAQRAGHTFAPREPLSDINTDLPFDPNDQTADWEYNPEISRDGRTLVFASLRPGGHGSGDLYVSCLRRRRWTEPLNVGPPVNTANDEFHPTLSRNGRTLYFVRTILPPAFVPSDFYSIPTKALGVRLRRCWRR